MKLFRKKLLSVLLALWLTSVCAGFMMPALHSTAYAAEKSLAVQGEFDNLCVMGLAEGKRIKTDCSVNSVFDGKTYCFRTVDAKTEFTKDPKRNLERAKDHFAAGEVTQTADDMGKYSVDDVKAWIHQYIQD
ncbi:MAG: hypothetical protein HOP21_01625, partial [Methylotenera sp.]|nr:hypothetical protein [Methylotenera sp.]